jgi:hypothetical protein
MSAAAKNANSACPCGTVAFPQTICNAAGLRAIAYRVGDFTAFRYRLLQPRRGETELTAWAPSAEGDLAVQMIEWWAYLADVLTFYNERIANEAYLGTALLPESVNHLVQLLGYRPRPALGARATLAALLAAGARVPLTLPARLQVQSKPGPGQPPQVFELDKQTAAQAPDVVIAQVRPDKNRLLSKKDKTVWLAGKLGGIKLGDRLLLINHTALTEQKIADYAWIRVSAVAAASDRFGQPVTQVSFDQLAGSIPDEAEARDYVLLRPQQSSPLWPYKTSSAVMTHTSLELAGAARGLTAGSLLLVDVADRPPAAGSVAKREAAPAKPAHPTAAIVQSYNEIVWYANGDGPNPGSTGTAANPVPAIAIPHAHIVLTTDLPPGEWIPAQVTLRWGWSAVGRLVPVLTASDLAYPGSGSSTLVVDPASKAGFPPGAAAALLEDGARNAAAATLTSAAGSPATATLGALTPPVGSLNSPIEVFFNLLKLSRGKTVPSEILGSGNPSVAGQDFTLAQAPVTYFFDPASISGDNFTSTVQVSVDGVQWQEVRSFYGQPPNAQVFVLREDDQGRTHVTFGDGVNGARLPTGTNNVVATYRHGAGAAAPAAETLTVVLTPTPGLKGVRNPLPPTGGSDADQPARLRALAPQSVLTFNRAVSLDDYAAIAATAPGVTQAVATFAFDPLAQRPVVTLWIAGDAGAVQNVAASLAATALPNQGLRILAAAAVEATLSLTYMRDPRYGDAAVRAGLTSALLDADTGLLGVNVVRIGQAIYDSQISTACLAVPGVTAIKDVAFTAADGRQFVPLFIRIRRFKHPGRPATPPACTGHRHDPGAGKYFSVPNDGRHLILNGVTAS